MFIRTLRSRRGLETKTHLIRMVKENDEGPSGKVKWRQELVQSLSYGWGRNDVQWAKLTPDERAQVEDVLQQKEAAMERWRERNAVNSLPETVMRAVAWLQAYSRGEFDGAPGPHLLDCPSPELILSFERQAQKLTEQLLQATGQASKRARAQKRKKAKDAKLAATAAGQGAPAAGSAG